MMLRVLEYMVHIWKKQVRDHVQKHGSAASVRLQPVLPVVFHTGRYPWERLGQLIDLMVDAADLRRHLPEFEPIFVNLPECPQENLAGAGAFGQVLRVVQTRRENRRRFGQVLGEAVGQLSSLASTARERWKENLAFLTQLVYHDRAHEEHGPFTEIIESSARTNEDRLEINMVRKSMAQVVQEDIARREAADTLVRLMRLRFKTLPAGMAERIEATRDVEQLKEWQNRFATATTLADVGILADD
jgi:hypothetical protein